MEFDFLYDGTEETKTRFCCIVGESMRRFDLAITTTNRFYGKKMVIDLQTGRSAVIGPDDLEEEGYLEHVYKINEEEAAELREFLSSLIGPISYSDI
ncbi:DUF3055 domain-containing protein [Paenibacillus sp. YYML68]|uniref:DUF3055 domain-containing protein n=1 Tax=Paenibacillus sp. YYML68 TaxID=2909250 RepID=UPI0024919AAD|nr:DUF3055 domain-containing protein [Paenibacillus sp. YYML68]